MAALTFVTASSCAALAGPAAVHGGTVVGPAHHGAGAPRGVYPRASYAPLSGPSALTGAPVFAGRVVEARIPMRHGRAQGDLRYRFAERQLDHGRYDGWSRHGWRPHSGVIVAAGSDVGNSRSFVEAPTTSGGRVAVAFAPQIIYVTPPPRRRAEVQVVYGVTPDRRARAATAAQPPRGRSWRERDGSVWREE